jgi:hypothetical protein
LKKQKIAGGFNQQVQQLRNSIGDLLGGLETKTFARAIV